MPTAAARPDRTLARGVRAALRRTYPRGLIKTETTPGGVVFVTLELATARYLGVGRDDALVANRIGFYLRRPVKVTSSARWTAADADLASREVVSGLFAAPGPNRCTFAVEADPGGPWPVDPGGSQAVPTYHTPAEVLGDFPANRPALALVKLAIAAGCRPHVAPNRSEHGPRYRVALWHTDARLLHGVFDVTETGGRFAEAWLSWGTGPERRTRELSEVRAQLTSARDLHHGRG